MILNCDNPQLVEAKIILGGPTLRLYDQTPEPKLVIACGDCASTGAPFTDCYNHNHGVNNVIPVDVFVPGCACRPEAIIDAVVLAIGRWREMANETPEEYGPEPDHEVRP